MSIKNGDGFSCCYLVYRYIPRGADAYVIGIIVTFVSAALAWIFLWGVTPKRGYPDGVNTDAGAITATFLMGVAPIGISWIMRESKGPRGREVALNLLVLLIGVAMLVVLVNLFIVWHFPKVLESVRIVFACLFSMGLILSVRDLAWYRVKVKFGAESESYVSLLCELGLRIDKAEDDMCCRWSPEWIGLDGHRYVAYRYDLDIVVR